MRRMSREKVSRRVTIRSKIRDNTRRLMYTPVRVCDFPHRRFEDRWRLVAETLELAVDPLKHSSFVIIVQVDRCTTKVLTQRNCSVSHYVRPPSSVSVRTEESAKTGNERQEQRLSDDMEVDENNATSNKETPATASGETPMEIDEDTSERNPAMSATSASAIKVMASSGTVGSVSISLHPLVIMNISEHWTRLRAQEGSDQLVYGALIGKQKGRNIEIMNSFELVFTCIGDDVIIDRDYYNTKEEQFKQVFSDMDFLGWYTTGDMPNERDIRVHKQLCEINESPVLLKLDPRPKNTDQLSVSMYESVIDLVNGEATMLFVPLTYTLATEEAERIGVDHVARMCNNDQGESSLVAEHLTAQHSAIKMLHSRVKLVLRYVQAVQNGELKGNHEVLRAACSLSHRLPVLNNPKFRADFYNQCNDFSLMTYLGIITKGCNNINQFVNKFNILYDRQGVGRRLRSLFF